MIDTEAKFSRIVDIFIPTKKNKVGKTFRFVRFAGVRDEKRVEEQLRIVWFDTYKVWVNVSRFDRGGSEVRTCWEKGVTGRSYSTRGKEALSKEGTRVTTMGVKTNQAQRMFRLPNTSYEQVVKNTNSGDKLSMRKNDTPEGWKGTKHVAEEDDIS